MATVLTHNAAQSSLEPSTFDSTASVSIHPSLQQESLKDDDDHLQPPVFDDVVGEIEFTAPHKSKKERKKAKKGKVFLSEEEKKYRAAEKDFIREGGVVYVPSELWVQHSDCARNCHIYVGTQSNLSIRPADENQEVPKTPHGHGIRPTSLVAAPFMAASGDDRFKFGLPDKVRIVNELLMTEMEKAVGYPNLNHDHVPPYRSIVPYHQKFRDLLMTKAREFSAMEPDTSLREAGPRNEYWIPSHAAYSIPTTGELDGSADGLTEVDIARIILVGLRSLVYFLNHDLSELVATYDKIMSGTIMHINFSFLWYLFEPGQEVVVNSPKVQAYRVLQVTGGRKSLVNRGSSNRRTVSPLAIDCFSLDYDGKKVGPVATTLYIQPYNDVIPIDKLAVYPLRYAFGDVRAQLATRGTRFAELAQVVHKQYKGLSLREGDLYDRYEEIDSDIIVDFTLAFRNSHPRIEMPVFGEGVLMKPTEEDVKETNEPGLYYDDEELLTQRWSEFYHRTTLLESRTMNELSDDSLILLPYRVYGYVLLSRKWLPMDIDLVRDIPQKMEGEQDSFNDLILPDGHKDIVRALVKTHSRMDTKINKFDRSNSMKHEFDLVKGKGKGLIILLHGAPGVGKTSTAECVAANTGRPLFPITCGDIGGLTAQDVEANLEKFFDLARKWGCVLLLDEADVFLSARSDNIMQNSLVSVFLRVLEYYSGILILTTNRVGEFDEAISSRVHCALYYPPLDRQRTLAIWKMNLERLDRQNQDPSCIAPIDFERDEILSFAKAHWKEGNRWNGRQIKNAFQTAAALAQWRHVNKKPRKDSIPRLSQKQFKQVAEASSHFERYLIAVRTSDESRAKILNLRHDDFEKEKKRGSKRVSDKRKPSVSASNWPSVPIAKYPEPDSATEETSSESDVDPRDSRKRRDGRDSEGDRVRSSKGGRKRKGKSAEVTKPKRELSSDSSETESE